MLRKRRKGDHREHKAGAKFWISTYPAPNRSRGGAGIADDPDRAPAGDPFTDPRRTDYMVLAADRAYLADDGGLQLGRSADRGADFRPRARRAATDTNYYAHSL